MEFTMLKCYFWAVLLVMGACAPLPPATTESNTSHTRQEKPKQTPTAQHLSHWTITGAVAAKSKRKAWTATIYWKQQALNRYQLRLMGPFGSESILVEKKGQLITYQEGKKQFTTTDIDKLFYQQTGIRVPLHHLYYWVRGIKAPGAIQSRRHDQSGHLILLVQSGYTIQYENYQTIQTFDLPTKIHIQGPEGQLKLIIKTWEIH